VSQTCRRKAMPASGGFTPRGLHCNSLAESSLSKRVICWVSADGHGIESWRSTRLPAQFADVNDITELAKFQ
jgi:hypothetical protein